MGTRPAVVFLDSYSWQTFTDLAGALRHHGVRLVRVSGRPETSRARVMQRLESWLHGPLHRLVDGGTLTGRPASVDPVALAAAVPSDALDVQMHDDLVLSALGVVDGPADPRRRLAAGVDPLVLVDKGVQDQWARKANVPTPRLYGSPDAVSLPVVVKARVGFGGSGVRIAHDRAALDHAYVELRDEHGRPPLLQQFLAKGVSTGGVALNGEVLVCASYDSHPSADDPNGPSAEIVTLDEPQAAELAGRFLAEIGYTGFFCFDWVRDAEGGLLLIDFNARVFGPFAALQDLGFDLFGAYLHTLGLAPRPAPSVGRLGETAAVVRYPCPALSSPEAVRQWRSDSLALVRRRRGWLGSRWALVVRVRTEVAALRALPTALRRSNRTSAATAGLHPRT